MVDGAHVVKPHHSEFSTRGQHRLSGPVREHIRRVKTCPYRTSKLNKAPVGFGMSKYCIMSSVAHSQWSWSNCTYLKLRHDSRLGTAGLWVISALGTRTVMAGISVRRATAEARATRQTKRSVAFMPYQFVGSVVRDQARRRPKGCSIYVITTIEEQTATCIRGQYAIYVVLFP
jgi:hypothetical protein